MGAAAEVASIECVCADGRPLGMQAYIPTRRGRGQGSKPQLTPRPALCLGDGRRSRMNWARIMHFHAINAAAGKAGVYGRGGC